MRFYQIALLFFLSFGCGAPVFAISSGIDIGVGLNLEKFEYIEELTAPAKSMESANLALLNANARVPLGSTSLLGSRGFLEFEFEGVIDANSDYEGTTLETNLPANATDKNTFFHLEATGNFTITDNLFFHVGYGNRYWKRYLTYGSGYKEIYTWSYLPLGFLYEAEVANGIKLGVDFTYKIMFGGKIDVIFSETVINGYDTSLDLGNKPGYKVSLPVEIAIQKNLKIRLRPYYEFSEIGESESAFNATPTGTNKVLGYIHEPASKTTRLGLVVAVAVALP